MKKKPLGPRRVLYTSRDTLRLTPDAHAASSKRTAATTTTGRRKNEPAVRFATPPELPGGLLTMKYVPPANFAPVERRLYRSAAPLPINFPFISLLGIKAIVWLAVEDPSDQLLDFVDDNDIRLEHLGVISAGSKPWDPMSDAAITEALNIIIDLRQYPVLVCCGMGRHRTGVVVGCLRKLQGWAFSSLVEEYQRFVGLQRERANVELAIENFDLRPVIEVVRQHYAEGKAFPPWFHRSLNSLIDPEQAQAIEYTVTGDDN